MPPLPKFDPTINVGHVVVAISVLIGGLGFAWEQRATLTAEIEARKEAQRVTNEKIDSLRVVVQSLDTRVWQIYATVLGLKGAGQ
jgi:prophage DNA circulation protein